MPAAPDAILEDHEGRTVLRFERVLRHPVERVWSALTEEGDLRRWHPSPFVLEPRAGGAVEYLPPDGAAFGEGAVTDYEPPRLLAHTWGEDHLRWELRPHDEGTLLVLRHTFDDHLKAARDAAGWHTCLAALGAALDGADGAGQADWRELNRAYQERFGIAPEDATPIPTGTTRATRRLEAPRERVFAVLTDPGTFPGWKVPSDMTCEVHDFDGTSFRVSLTYDDPAREGKTAGRTDTYRGRFAELVPDEKVVEVDEFETDDPQLQGAMTITVTLADAPGGGTDHVALHEGLPHGVRPEDNEAGWNDSLARLAAFVEGR
jgi:uncharacterized protein YndB with AHSA1/START domain